MTDQTIAPAGAFSAAYARYLVAKAPATPSQYQFAEALFPHNSRAVAGWGFYFAQGPMLARRVPGRTTIARVNTYALLDQPLELARIIRSESPDPRNGSVERIAAQLIAFVEERVRILENGEDAMMVD